MATQCFKRNPLLNLNREGKTYRWFVSSCRLREIKMSGTGSLFPPFGDPWPSCLLLSQLGNIVRRARIFPRSLSLTPMGTNENALPCCKLCTISPTFAPVDLISILLCPVLFPDLCELHPLSSLFRLGLLKRIGEEEKSDVTVFTSPLLSS